MKTNGKKWEVFGASLIGKFHLQNNIPNQDSFNFKINNNGIVLAIADGLGSKKYSHIGAGILTKEVIKLNRTFYKNKKMFEKKLIKNWKTHLKEKDISYKDALSTLMFIIVKNGKIYLAKVGDGMAVVLGKSDLIFDENKNFGNITTPFSYKKLKWYEFNEEDIELIFLATDGISDDIKDKFGFVKAFKNYFIKLPKYKKEIEAKRMLQEWKVKGSVDDKTFICLMKDK